MNAPENGAQPSLIVIEPEDLRLLRDVVLTLATHPPVNVTRLTRVMDTLFKGVAISNRVPAGHDAETATGAQEVLADIRRTLGRDQHAA